MDASTQTTIPSSGYAHSSGNPEPDNEKHEPRCGGSSEVGMKSGDDRTRSGLHSDSNLKQRVPAASSGSSFTGAVSSDNSGVAVPLSSRQISKSQPPRSGETSSTVLMPPPGLPLRRRQDLQSQAGVNILAAPTSQDSVTIQQETYLLKVCRTLMMFLDYIFNLSTCPAA
ncbi:hypothetical protein V495_01522 [Pseudogymnoascus sp. VKM F-4514 (FW-929)]|nr:hypothetical protein V490_08565 [Pseudogymnoascus sp. VKM F-3557]KFY48219.1 hypothetical protein V495_01522 [Pseudogymnoascus sp. VKM F-4514 (FW-929)]KFY51700.1 hypothetical protein V497_08934 [Pseudogymnoascus sp. VKM F-4516 (FW-969)]